MTTHQFRFGRKTLTVEENALDRAIGYFSPELRMQRLRSRIQTAAITGGYNGGKRGRRQTSEWAAANGDADFDFLPDQDMTRARSRDLVRNNPVAAGTISTNVDYVVGSGLKLKPLVDRTALGLTEKAADELEANILREWNLWAQSPECDIQRRLTFAQFQALSLRSVLESGDMLVTLPFLERDGSPYGLKLQAIESDRVCNPGFKADTQQLRGGVESDQYGADVRFHVCRNHPGARFRSGAASMEWDVIEAHGKTTGRRNAILLRDHLRPGQSRGIPLLAPVIETLKQLDRYTEAELMAAVISGMFTVFIKSPMGESLDLTATTAETGASRTDDDIKMATGAIVGLMPGEDIATANPGRPNTAYDAFVTSIIQQIAVGLGLPHEVLMKRFTSSYSASKAALLVAWKFFMGRRHWLASQLCDPVYEAFMIEAVARGRISAPGFLNGDPIIRAAYLGCEWNGDAPGHLDEMKEAQAAGERIRLGLSNEDRETTMLTGLDWEQTAKQRAKELRRKRELGITPEPQPAFPDGPDMTRKENDQAG